MGWLQGQDAGQGGRSWGRAELGEMRGGVYQLVPAEQVGGVHEQGLMKNAVQQRVPGLSNEGGGAICSRSSQLLQHREAQRRLVSLTG